jgi:hypothetical protein
VRRRCPALLVTVAALVVLATALPASAAPGGGETFGVVLGIGPWSTPRTAAAHVGGFHAVDPTGDALPFGVSPASPHGDVTNWAVTYDASGLTLDFDVASPVDPLTDAGWADNTRDFALWELDVNHDGEPDYDALYYRDAGPALAGMVQSFDGGTRCSGATVTASWVASTTYRLQFPGSCIGDPASFDVGVVLGYGQAPNQPGQPFTMPASFDFAPNSDTMVGVSVASRAVASRGFTVDAWGGLHPFWTPTGGAPARPVGAPYWHGWDIARGVAVPQGLATTNPWGLVLDAWGGLHPFGVGTAAHIGSIHGAPYWRAWDIARDVALLPDGTGGVVLDGWGGLHSFAVGSHTAPTTHISAYWSGQDVATGVAMLPDGSGGYVLDAFGGLHPFSVGAHSLPPLPVYASRWAGWRIATGVTMLADGTGGYVTDAFGGLHSFSITKGTTPALPGHVAYWRGWPIVRGVADSISN